MNASQSRDLGTEAIRDAANFPLMKALGRKRELRLQNPFEVIEQFAMIVSSHSPLYPHSVDVASGEMLIAGNHVLLQTLRMTLPDRIVAAYTALGLNQAQAARRCGFSTSRFGNYVKGTRTPKVADVIQIANALETTPNALLGVNEDAGAELADILGKLLELEGLAPESARTIAAAASATQQLLKSLPGNGDDQDRTLLAAQAVWSARRHQEPRKP